METDEHIFISCPVARQVWRRLGLDADTLDLRRPWQFPLNSMLPDTVCIDVVLLLLWHMWKARNAKNLDHVISCALYIIRRVLKDLDLWSCSFGVSTRIWRSWSPLLANCSNSRYLFLLTPPGVTRVISLGMPRRTLCMSRKRITRPGRHTQYYFFPDAAIHVCSISFTC